MNMVLPDNGLDTWALLMADAVSRLSAGVNVMLFKNNITVGASTVYANLVLADFPGFVQYSLDPTKWVDVPPTSNVSYFKNTVPPVFTCTGGPGQLVYGWGMYTAPGASVFLLAAQNFDTPRNMIPGWQEVLDPFQLGIKTLA